MSGFDEYLGLEWDPGSGGSAQVRLSAVERHLNPHGTVHGGVLGSLADVASTKAVESLAARTLAVTIELKITFLSPAWPGLLVADARVINTGRTIIIVETEIKQDQEWVAHAIGTFTVRG
jgi:acyl-CoA thioesterase